MLGIITGLYRLYIGLLSEDYENTELQDQWDSYSKRLKSAYSSKFGGENKGFDDEVDCRNYASMNLKSATKEMKLVSLNTFKENDE